MKVAHGTQPFTILRGTVGSTAHGLHLAESDDRDQMAVAIGPPPIAGAVAGAKRILPSDGSNSVISLPRVSTGTYALNPLPVSSWNFSRAASTCSWSAGSHSATCSSPFTDNMRISCMTLLSRCFGQWELAYT